MLDSVHMESREDIDMSKYKKNARIAAVVALLLGVSGLFSLLYSEAARDIYYQVAQNIRLFGQVYQTITERYIQQVDAEKFMRAGIDGMLDRLDPYSVYLEKEDSDELRILTSGKYYGVGMRIVIRNGWATVAEQPFPNSPAARAGIREGDQIVAIDGQSTQGWTLSETAGHLRGSEKGSQVRVTIRRIGEKSDIEFTLIRDEIVVTNIQFAGFIAPGIGVVKLAQFNRDAAEQVQDEIENMIDQGLTGLILDLRGNPGGLLDVAVQVADLFLEKGELIVFTQGRDSATRQDFFARNTPLVSQSIPLVVLVDEYSASASEIVAGAIQDLDRGVILGSETFGKGLVQTVVPLDRRGEKQLKLTTAQYYMPSGRLIQRADIFPHGRASVFVGADTSAAATENKKEADSTAAAIFYTRNGRQVYGGGGIRPDFVLTNFALNRYELELMRQSMFFNYSLNYVSQHPELSADFSISDQVLNDFESFLRSKEFTYKPNGYEYVEKLIELSEKDSLYRPLTAAIAGLGKEFDQIRQEEMTASRDHIRVFLEREIAGKAFGRDAYYRASFHNDSVLQKSVELLKDSRRYQQLLTAPAVSAAAKGGSNTEKN